MNGLVAVVSRTPEVLARGPQALARLRYFPFYDSCAIESDGAWLGACGPSGWQWCAGAGANDACGGAVATDGTAAVVCGDMVNAVALRRELGLAADASPALIALAAWRRWAGDLFRRLEGACTIVVHDPGRATTVAGCDARSIANLYALEVDGDVWFFTQAKALAVEPRFRLRMAERALAELLAIGFLHCGLSVADDVRSLLRCEHFEVKGGRLSVVSHHDDTAIVGDLRGHAYVDHLAASVRELVAEATADDDVALPLTGGLDSRTLAAALPASSGVVAMTFGGPRDGDTRVALRVARRRGLPHILLPMQPDYVARSAAETVWLTEGAVHPVDNITGSLMDRVAGLRSFVSGSGGEVGRRSDKAKAMLVDFAMLEAPEPEFERRFLAHARSPAIGRDLMIDLVAGDGGAFFDLGYENVTAVLRSTRGLDVVDRIDLWALCSGESRPRSKLRQAAFRMQPRVPFHSQRWVEAVMSGHRDERLDDVARLRLVWELDRRLAMIPWVVTHAPLPASAALQSVLRGVARRRARGAPPAPTPAAAALPLLSRAKKRLYRPSEDREEWLRTVSRAYVEDVLLSERFLERGIFRPQAVRDVVAAQMAGEARSKVLGPLLAVELWHRLFVDGDKPPVGAAS